MNMNCEDINFEHSCRLCLKPLNNEPVPIFETDSNYYESSIPIKIKLCVCIDVKAIDPFPQYICKDCRDNLNNFCIFKQTCEATDVKLKQHYEKWTSLNNPIYGVNSYTIKTEQNSSEESSTEEMQLGLHDVNSETPSTDCPQSHISNHYTSSRLKNDSEIAQESCQPICIKTEHDPEDDNAETILISDVNDTKDFLYVSSNQCTSSLPLDNIIRDVNIKMELTDITSHNDDENNSNNSGSSSVISTTLHQQAEEQLGDCQTEAKDASILMTKINEYQPLREDVPLSHYMTRKIIGIENGNFVYDITEEAAKHTGITSIEAYEGSKYGTLRKNYKCSFCEEYFRRIQDLKTHHDTHLPKESIEYVCCVCPEAFSAKKFLEDHEQIHASGSFFQCKTCTTICLTLCELKQHVKVHSTKWSQCPCGKNFHTLSSYREHRRAHRNECASYVCQHCGRRFRYYTPFQNHVATCGVPHVMKENSQKVVQTMPVFKCNMCNVTFEHKGVLICHEASIHHNSFDTGIFEGVFECDICNKRCKELKELREHKVQVHGLPRLIPTISSASHRSIQSFTCKSCNIEFEHKGALICHQAFYHRLGVKANTKLNIPSENKNKTLSSFMN